MTTEEKRIAISQVYPGASWKRKVADMSDSQVIAVYLSFEKNGTFRKDLKKHNKPYEDKRERRENRKEYKQLTIEDFINF